MHERFDFLGPGAERFLFPFALGNILADSDQVQRISIRVANQRNTVLDPDLGPVAADVQLFDREWRDLSIQQPRDMVTGAPDVIGMDECVERHRQ